tara:strand:- start:793 stop:966 length:174 start_codon:yes stop_codon:yes gene_type:complete
MRVRVREWAVRKSGRQSKRQKIPQKTKQNSTPPYKKTPFPFAVVILISMQNPQPLSV